MEEDLLPIKESLKKEIQRLESEKKKLEKASWLPIDKELELLDSINTTITILLRTYTYVKSGKTIIEDNEAQALLEKILQ